MVWNFWLNSVALLNFFICKKRWPKKVFVDIKSICREVYATLHIPFPKIRGDQLNGESHEIYSQERLFHGRCTQVLIFPHEPALIQALLQDFKHVRHTSIAHPPWLLVFSSLEFTFFLSYKKAVVWCKNVKFFTNNFIPNHTTTLWRHLNFNFVNDNRYIEKNYESAEITF